MRATEKGGMQPATGPRHARWRMGRGGNQQHARTTRDGEWEGVSNQQQACVDATEKGGGCNQAKACVLGLGA